MYLHDWKHENEMLRDFEISADALKGAEVLLASYSYENYSGGAFVLFRRDGKLFEVDGGHCSCNGLEGQWKPEETTIDALRHRLTAGRLGSDDYCGNVFKDELVTVLDRLATQ